MSEMAVRNVVDDGIDVHFYEAGEGVKMRRCGRAGSGCFVDEAHDIVTISTVVESGDP